MKSFKNILAAILMLLPFCLTAQVTFLNPKPEAGSMLKFSYDPSGTKLAGKDDIECYAYVFHQTKQQISPVKLIREGSVYNGTFQTTDSTSLVALQISSDGMIDDNSKGYYITMFKNGKPTAYTHLSEAILLDYYGENLRMKPNFAKASQLYLQAFGLQPDLKRGQPEYRYMVSSYNADPVKGGEILRTKIAQLSRASDEQSMSMLSSLYHVMKQPAKVDSVNNLMLAKFPTGSYAWSVDYNAIIRLKDPVAMERKVIDFKKKYGYGDSKADAQKMSWIYERLAGAYGAAGNYDKFDLYSSQIADKVNRAALYNSIAWPLAEKNENSGFAARISKLSLDLLDAAKADEYPAYFQNKESYLASLKRSHAMYADTYALILHNLGNDKDAVTHQESAMEFSDADGNERYVMYLDLSGNKEKALAQAEGFLREGKGTEAMKNRLKALYELNTSTMPFETYIANLEKAAHERGVAEWKKKMINIPAPAFSLLNMKGETVSLASLKGKVVVLDYWATWCGPCVASFPGMQKAVTKYANNPNVVFLFINTRQTEGNREELVQKFIAEKKYTFNVLYDTKSKKDPSQFDLINAYEVSGIPTKFIIDGEGKIRFKVVGFSGSADSVVKELDTMISLASAKP
ncbi:TlpA family protein disulfide reductase [Pedobacter sp. GR22-6]|uniref:TlpA family protein disulfide reductase n=1 Tax=Pedobacter sp. GR22-6 TaxID=3127957 RepID=UPI00307DBB86